jgi:hypothetical protein
MNYATYSPDNSLTPDQTVWVAAATVPAAALAAALAWLLRLSKIHSLTNAGYQPWQDELLWVSTANPHILSWACLRPLVFHLGSSAITAAAAAGCFMAASFGQLPVLKRIGLVLCACFAFLLLLIFLIPGGQVLRIDTAEATISGGTLAPGGMPLNQITCLAAPAMSKTHDVSACLTDGTKLPIISLNNQAEVNEVANTSWQFITGQNQ